MNDALPNDVIKDAETAAEQREIKSCAAKAFSALDPTAATFGKVSLLVGDKTGEELLEAVQNGRDAQGNRMSRLLAASSLPGEPGAPASLSLTLAKTTVSPEGETHESLVDIYTQAVSPDAAPPLGIIEKSMSRAAPYQALKSQKWAWLNVSPAGEITGVQATQNNVPVTLAPDAVQAVKDEAGKVQKAIAGCLLKPPGL